MNNYWVGVIVGCVMGIVIGIICIFCTIRQNDMLITQVCELKEMVQEHERIMRAYEFYNWQFEKRQEVDHENND